MEPLPLIQLIIGLVILIVSGEILVKGSVGIAIKMRLSTLVIGMTVVSFGTSAPELLVAVKAVLSNRPDVALGAVIGSNISNLGLVLGITALVMPLSVQRDTMRVDWPMMIISTVLFILLIQNGELGTWEGIALLTLLVIFNIWLIRRSRLSNKNEEATEIISRTKRALHSSKDLLLIGLGCVGLVYGAHLFVDGADDIALWFGISHRVIGLTVVAIGTSLPELITSLVAAYRKQTDISVGNLIGSSIFNLCGILGIASIVKPISVNIIMLTWDSWWLLAISIIILPLMLFKQKVGRLSGLFLVIFYIVYVKFVFIKG